jgi:dihydrolipoamide dehydrogenase
VQYDRKGIRVDDKYETNEEGVFAIGDVTGGIMLAHVASEAGKACVEGIMGQKPDINHNVVPAVVFTNPEIATVGLTEEKAQQNGMEVSVGRFMFGANSKAVAQGEEFGFVKVVVNKLTEEIIGAHILGPDAGTIIHEAALAIANGLTVSEIENTIHAHPTLSEAFHEAVMNAADRAIHTAPKRK